MAIVHKPGASATRQRSSRFLLAKAMAPKRGPVYKVKIPARGELPPDSRGLVFPKAVLANCVALRCAMEASGFVSNMEGDMRVVMIDNSIPCSPDCHPLTFPSDCGRP